MAGWWSRGLTMVAAAALLGGILLHPATAAAEPLPVDNFTSAPVTVTYSGQGGWTQTPANSFDTTLTSIDGWNVVVEGQAGASAGTWNWSYPITLQAQPDVSGTSLLSGTAEVSWVPSPASSAQPTWQTHWGLYADTSVLLINQATGQTITVLSAGSSSLPVSLGLTGESFAGAVGTGQTATAGGQNCENLTWLVSAVGTAELGPLDLPATLVTWVLSNLTSSGLQVCMEGTIHGAPVQATVQGATGFAATGGNGIQLPFPGGVWSDVPYGSWNGGPLTLDLGSLQYAPTFDLSMDVQLALANQSVTVAQVPLGGTHSMAAGTWSPSSAALNLNFPTEAVIGVQGPGITATVKPTASGGGPTFTAEVPAGQQANFTFDGSSSSGASGPSGLNYAWSITPDGGTSNIGSGIDPTAPQVTVALSPGQYSVTLQVDDGSGQQSSASLYLDVETAPTTPGTLTVDATGLPTSGGSPTFTVGDATTGFQQTLQGPGTLQSVPPGTYTVTPTAVTASDGTVFEPSPSKQEVTVTAGSASTTSFAYAAGTGSVQLVVGGLPDGTPANVSITGPNGFSQSFTGSADLLGLWPGSYTVMASAVTTGGGTEYDPILSGVSFSTMTLGLSSQQGTFGLQNEQDPTVDVSYSAPAANVGSLEVHSSGLPSGTSPEVTVSQPSSGYTQDITTSDQVLTGLDPGSYTVTAATVTGGGNTYQPTPASQTVTVLAGSTAEAPVVYAAMTGNLQVTVDGLPTGVPGSALVSGPGHEPVLTGSQTLTGLVPGSYTVTANPVTTVAGVPYIATVSPATPVAVQAGQTAQVTVTYAVHTLILSAAPRSVPAGGSSTSLITATVWGATGPQSDAVVTLTTTAGTLTVGNEVTTAGASIDGTTNGEGQVVASLGAGSSAAVATVTATVTVGGQSSTATITVEFTAGASSATQLKLLAAPTSVGAGGVSVVTATVTDSLGDPLSGVAVTLTTDLGTLSSGSDVIATGSPLQGTTNSKGQVSAVLSSAAPGKATVTATVSPGGGASPLRETATVGFSAAQTAVASTVKVAASPSSVAADGQSTSTVTVTVQDAQGNPVTGATVQLKSDLGELQAGYTFGGTVTVSSGATGQATAQLSSSSVGTATVTAQVVEGGGASGPQGQATVSFVTPSATPTPSTLQIQASPTSVPADGQTASTLTVTVKSATGAALAGVNVEISTDLGELQAGSVLGPSVWVTTGANGEGTAQLTSGGTGSASVQATVILADGSNGPTKSTPVDFVAPGTPQAVATVVLSASPSTVPADGQTAALLTATVKDQNGQAVAGVDVGFASTVGSFSVATVSGGSTQTTVATNAEGQAQVALTSTAAGTAVVEASVGSVESKPLDVTFSATVPNGSSLELSANPQDVVANGTSASAVTATLTDLLGNPVQGVSVSFSGPAGTLSASSAVTDAEGQATEQITNNQVGTVTVTATAGAVQESTSVTFTNSSGSNACLLASPSTLAVTGTSKLTVELTTTGGGPAAGVEVSLSSSLGTVTPSTVTTGADGTATAELTQSEPGTADVTAQVTGYSSQKASVPSQMVCDTQVTFTDGPGSLTLASTPQSVPADGSSKATITATVLDTSGNPAPGVQVSFSDDNALGTLSAQSAVTDASGEATVTLTSTAEGTAIVSAQVTNTPSLAQTVSVVFSGTSGSSATPTACANAQGFPVVTGVSPSSGPLDGGNTVAISGCNLGGATEVDFGDAGAVLSFSVNSSGTSIAVQAPNSLSGFGETVDVTVLTGVGTSAVTTADQYTYSSSGGSCGSIPGSTNCITAGPAPSEGAPTIKSLSPSSGNEFGYTKVIITGTNLLAATQVSFGSVTESVNGGNVSVPNTAAFKILSSTEISAIAPPAPSGNPGTVQVQVTTPEGTSSAASYTYTAPSGPEVMAVIPQRGMAAGGQQVIIKGQGFTSSTAVDFSTVELGNGQTSLQPANPASFQVVNDTEIIATSPPAPGEALLPAPGSETVDVTVTGPSAGGSVTSTITPADEFTYEVCSPYAPAFGTPVVNYVSPDVGPSTGGTEVTIRGESFSPGSEVYFGSQKATGVTVLSGTHLTAIAPKGSGSVDVKVFTPSGGWSPTCGVDVYQYQATTGGQAGSGSGGGSTANQAPPPPIITGISPNYVIDNCGDSGCGPVQVYGANFAPSSRVLVGNVPVPWYGVQYVSAGQLTVLLPPAPTDVGGPFKVHVVTSSGSSTEAKPGDAVVTYLPATALAVKQVTVPVTEPWTDTGITVTAGELVSIAGFGQASEKAVVPHDGMYYGTINTSNTYTPAGQGLPCDFPLMSWELRGVQPAPDVSCFSLIARVGTAPPQEVGEGTVFVAQGSGELYLGPNNVQAESGVIISNSGSWGAVVSVASPSLAAGFCPPPPPPSAASWLHVFFGVGSTGYSAANSPRVGDGVRVTADAVRPWPANAPGAGTQMLWTTSVVDQYTVRIPAGYIWMSTNNVPGDGQVAEAVGAWSGGNYIDPYGGVVGQAYTVAAPFQSGPTALLSACSVRTSGGKASVIVTGQEPGDVQVNPATSSQGLWMPASSPSSSSFTVRFDPLTPPFVSGRAVDPAGNPVVGMWVDLHSTGSGNVYAERTGQRGRFTFSAVTPGTYTLSFSGGGSTLDLPAGVAGGSYSSAASGGWLSPFSSSGPTALIVTTAGLNVPTVTLPPGQTIAGTVVTDGGPGLSSGSFTVEACAAPGYSPFGTCTSATPAADGAFSLSGLAAGPYFLDGWEDFPTSGPMRYPDVWYATPRVAGGPSYTVNPDLASAVAAPAAGVVLTLPEGFYLSGQVVDGSGAAVTAGSVNATSTACATTAPCSGPSASVGANGSYQLGPLLPGSYILQVCGDASNSSSTSGGGNNLCVDYTPSSPGFSLGQSIGLGLLSPTAVALGGADQTGPTLVLPRLLTVSGRVVDSSGHGVAGVYLTACLAPGMDGLGSSNEDVTGACTPIPVFGWSGESTTTDQNGDFQLAVISPGRYLFDVVPPTANPGSPPYYIPGWFGASGSSTDAPATLAPLAVQAVNVTGLTLTLQPAYLVSGMITGLPPSIFATSGGSPVDSVDLEVCPQDQSTVPCSSGSFMDSEGDYEVVVPNGTYSLIVTVMTPSGRGSAGSTYNLCAPATASASCPPPQVTVAGAAVTGADFSAARPTVAVDPAAAGAVATYTVVVPAPSGLYPGQTMSVSGPSGTVFPAAPADYRVTGYQGLGTVVQAVYAVSPAAVTVVVPATAGTSMGGTVTLSVYGVTNPGAAGMYTLSVSTAEGQAAMTSLPYMIGASPSGAQATVLRLTNASGVAGGAAELQATLTAGGSPLSVRSIAFTVDGRSAGEAVTSGTGIATVTASLAGLNAGTSYPVTASFAGDAQDQASGASAWLAAVPAPLAVDTTALPTATLGTPYAATLLPTGGVPPYTWSLIGGSLPTGLGLNTVTGQVYGTPTAVGTSNLTFRVSDASLPTPQTATVGLTLAVQTQQALSDLTVGVHPALGGATATYTLGFVAPSGLSVGQAVYLAAPTGTVFPAGAQNYLLSASVSQAVYGGGGAVVRIVVPQGLAIPEGGSVTATVYGVQNPGAGTYNLQGWTTADPSPATSAPYSLAAGGGGALSITVSNLPSATVKVPYSASLTASGGTPPYTWTVSLGSLPPGLQLDQATGVISGTPTASGAWSVTLQVQDASSPSQSASEPLLLTVGSGTVSTGLEAQVYLTPGVSFGDGGQAGLEMGVQGITGAGSSGEMVTGFQATLSYDPSHVHVLDVYCHPPFGICASRIDHATGTVDIAAATGTATAVPAEVVFVAMRVTGSVTESTTVSLTVQEVTDQNENPLAVSGPVSVTLQRGAVLNACSSTGQPVSGARAVGIGDAVAGLQFLVGLKTAGTGCGHVNPVNLASLVPSSNTGQATPGIGNVVALLRYLVHLVGPHMNPLPAGTS